MELRSKVKTYDGDGPDLWDKSLQLPAKRLEHQLGTNVWNQALPGDNARDTIPPRFDGRLLNPERNMDNFSEYNNPAVNRLIDRALAEPDRARRGAMWAGIDQRIMRDAPIVPLIWQDYSFYWASQVHGWVFDPWASMPDLTAVWLASPSS